MSKEFFKEHNVQYAEKDVSKDAEAREDIIKRSGQMGVPVIDIDGNLVVGFDEEKLSELLGIN
jgi:glutaredoxin